MENQLTGQCLCGEVSYTLADNFKNFYQCHCKQCRQLTGSAFASNILTDPNNIEWLSGQNNIATFQHPTRDFSSSFCRICGSALPFVNKSRTSLIVPARSLNDLPSIQPQANIFNSEEAPWLQVGLRARKFEGFAEQLSLRSRNPVELGFLSLSESDVATPPFTYGSDQIDP